MPLLALALPAVLQPVCWLLLAFAGAAGVVALASPRLFAILSTNGSRWVDTQKLLQVLDKRVDLDACVLPYSRVLGGLVIASVAVLGWLMLTY